jgi:hypothetical protein
MSIGIKTECYKRAEEEMEKRAKRKTKLFSGVSLKDEKLCCAPTTITTTAAKAVLAEE